MVSWFSPVDRRLRQRFFSALSDDSNPSLAQRLASTLLLWSGMPPPCRNLLVCPPAELPNGSSSSSTVEAFSSWRSPPVTTPKEVVIASFNPCEKN